MDQSTRDFYFTHGYSGKYFELISTDYGPIAAVSTFDAGVIQETCYCFSTNEVVDLVVLVSSAPNTPSVVQQEDKTWFEYSLVDYEQPEKSVSVQKIDFVKRLVEALRWLTTRVSTISSTDR
jgi:hypothetical protein